MEGMSEQIDEDGIREALRAKARAIHIRTFSIATVVAVAFWLWR